MWPPLLRNMHLHCLRGKPSFHFLKLMFISKFTPQHVLYHNDLSITVFYQENYQEYQ